MPVAEQANVTEIIVMQDVNKCYGEFHALRDINLRVKTK